MQPVQRRKRVLHVLYSLERSGMEMMLACSFAAWGKAGYECEVLATAPQEGPIADELRGSGYRVHHLPFRGYMHFMPSQAFVRGFRRLCRGQFDVVHIHTEETALLCGMLAKSAGVKRIAITPHNAFGFRGFLRLRKIIERIVLRILGTRYGMISESVSANERKRFFNHGVPVSNWIDTETFLPPTEDQRRGDRKTFGFEENDFVIVSVGNCNPAKNHGELLRALAWLTNERWFYLHIGKEEEGRYERRLADELGILDRVRFLGSVAGLRPLFWACDCFVMPSAHEGLPISCLEALGCGVPAVVSDVAGLRDVAAVADEVILTSTDAQSIAAGILKLMAQSGVDRRAVGARCSQRIRDVFSIEQGIRSIAEGLYKDGSTTGKGAD